jgi:hypothetical protein
LPEAQLLLVAIYREITVAVDAENEGMFSTSMLRGRTGS